MTPLTFHGDPQLKAELLARIAAHELADNIHVGQYAARDEQGRLRVCAVGCAMVEPDTAEIVAETGEFYAWYGAQEERWGIPAWLGLLEDSIFERLPDDERPSWPRRLVGAIPVGVDLSMLPDRLAVRRLREAVLPLAPTWPDDLRDECVAAIERVIASLESDGDRDSTESAAWSAVRLVAWSAWSVRSAAWSAAWSVRSAAWSAAETDPPSLERSAEWLGAWSPASAALAAARSAARSVLWSESAEAQRLVEELERAGKAPRDAAADAAGTAGN